MKSYLVEVDMTKTIRQRTQVVVTTKCDFYDKDVSFEIKNKAEKTIEENKDSLVWQDIPGTEHRGGVPYYTISPVLVAREGDDK